MDEETFRLSAELRGHEEDVRGICIRSDGAIITGSRDKTVKLWAPASQGYELVRTFRGHTSFVGPVAWVDPCQNYPRGAIVSGGMDKRVLVWDWESGAVMQELTGHDNQVTCLAVTSTGDIFSGSLDMSIRHWKNSSCIQVLRGHEGTVLALQVLSSGDLASGSQDATVKLWRGGACVHTFRGHADTVRGLAEMPGVGILSASHDQSIRLWAFSGESLLEMWGHSALVYSVSATSSGLIASGSEDNTARVWQNGTAKETIEHPGCVWDVKFLPNGDLVTACSDGITRVWTIDHHRFAPPEVLEAFDSQMVAKAASKTVGGVNIGSLPGPEALDVSGKKDGQTLMVREGIKGAVYTWSMATYKWEKVGYLEDQAGPPPKKEYLGQQYDYVFDVDIADGAPARKLPFNIGDNPYTSADKFLMDNELPMTYREQVVAFIIQNTGGAKPPANAPMGNVDPFTGGQSYAPNSGLPMAGKRGDVNVGNVDPLTGAAAYSSGRQSAAPSSTPAYKQLPMRGFLAFDSAQYEGIVKKLEEFNAALAADVSTQSLVLSQDELSRIQAITTALKSSQSNFQLQNADQNILQKLLSWPTPNLFPTLDLLRMLILQPFGDFLSTPNFLGVLLEVLQRVAKAPAVPGNLLTASRLVANCFRREKWRSWAAKNRSDVLDHLAECSQSSNRKVRLAFSTLVLNYSSLLSDTKDQDGQLQCLSASVELANNANDDDEAFFRAMVAIGTLVLKSSLKDVANDLDAGSLVETAKKLSTSKVVEVGQDIARLLQL